MVKRIRADVRASSRQPLARNLPAAKPFQEMGVSGTAVYSGFIQQKDRAAGWKGTKRYETSTDILANISIVAASVRFFLNLISYPDWSVVPPSDSDPEAVRLAEFVEDVLYSMVIPLPRVVRKSGTFQFHGFGVQEWLAAKRDDGLIGIKTIEARPQHTIERWAISDSGEVEGVWQRSPQTNALLGIPRRKLVYLVEDTFTDSPEGFGIFRNLLEPYNRLKQYLDLETRTFERDLRGIPVGRAPIGAIRRAVDAGAIAKEDGERLITEIKRAIEIQVKDSNTGVLLDSQPYESQAADGFKVSSVMQWDLSLLQGTANGLDELAKAIDRLQREMARIMGTEQLMMGDQGGNRALSLDKSRNLYLIANSVLSNIVSAYDRDIIDTIWLLNGFPEDKKPWLQAEDVAFKDVLDVTASLREMAAAGAVLDPNDPAIDDVRDLLGISRSVVNEQLLGEPASGEGDNGEVMEEEEDDSANDEEMEEEEETEKAKKPSRRRVRARRRY